MIPPLAHETAALARLAGPIAGIALLNMGMSLTDAVMVARLGPGALAAVAVVSDLYSIVFYVATGFVMVLAPLIAQARGAGRDHEVRGLVRAGMAAAVLAAGPAACAVWSAPALLGALGVAPDIVAAGRGYAAMMGGTVALLVVVILWRTVLAAHERPHVFLAFAALALPLNAAGNQLFMYGGWGVPALGPTGAGASSLLVAAVMAVGLTLTVAVTLRPLSLFARPWRVETARVADILRQGVPTGLGSLGEVGLYLIATPLVALFGAEAVAAHIVALRTTGVLYAVENSLGQAATIRIAHALGTGDGVALRRRVMAALLLACVLGLAILVILGSMGGGLLRIVAVLHLPLAFGTVALGVLRGHKDLRVPMLTTNASYWCLGLPVVGLLAFGLDLREHGVWLGIGAGAFCAAWCSGRRLSRVLTTGDGG